MFRRGNAAASRPCASRWKIVNKGQETQSEQWVNYTTTSQALFSAARRALVAFGIKLTQDSHFRAEANRVLGRLRYASKSGTATTTSTYQVSEDETIIIELAWEHKKPLDTDS